MVMITITTCCLWIIKKFCAAFEKLSAWIKFNQARVADKKNDNINDIIDNLFSRILRVLKAKFWVTSSILLVNFKLAPLHQADINDR